jgi:hypothetical protein
MLPCLQLANPEEYGVPFKKVGAAALPPPLQSGPPPQMAVHTKQQSPALLKAERR